MVQRKKGLNLPDLKLYYAGCYLVWMTEWVRQRNRKLLESEGHGLRFGWHGSLWYNKVKVNMDFKNHYVRHAILRIWNR